MTNSIQNLTLSMLAGAAGAIALTFAALWVGNHPFVPYANFSETWIEHVQHFTLLACAIVCAVKSRGLKNWIWLGGAAFFIFLLGEELNWGQTLLDFETPGAIAAVNAHGELSMHNLDILIQYSKKIGIVLFSSFFAAASLVILRARPGRFIPLTGFIWLFAASIMTLYGGRAIGMDILPLFAVDEFSETMTYAAILGGLALVPREVLKIGLEIMGDLLGRFMPRPQNA